MSEMEQIESKIAITEAALTDAKSANDRDLTIMYGNQLTEQRREKNLLLTTQLGPAAAASAVMQHNLPVVRAPLIVNALVCNPVTGLEITVPFRVNDGCKVVPVLLNHSDVIALKLSAAESVSALDSSTISTISLLQSVEVTLTFSDGTVVTGLMNAGYFSPPLHTTAPAIAVVTEDARILGYEALKILGLKQDYKARCLTEALRRI